MTSHDPDRTPPYDPQVEPTQDLPAGTARSGTASGWAGTRCGDYELLREIARGGMGVVYEARQVSLNRVVAVKMILAGRLADESAIRRFRQEAEAAAGLDHPGIVPVHEVGEHDGQHFFAMGFVEGESLAALLARGPVEPQRAAELLEAVARAVHFAHERGVIHRDLKPSNVLLDRDGRPRVTDFGLAKVESREQSLTATGQVLGTPSFMSPEQVTGDETTAATDVYGLGAILYSLLSGRPPFQAATAMETLLQVRQADAVPPRQLNPGVPRDLDTIVLKCLHKWPARRYASAAALADDLRRFLAGEPISARPAGLLDQAGRWFAQQSRSVMVASIAVAATVLLSLVGVVGWTWYEEDRLGRVSFQAERPPLTAEVLDERGAPAVPAFTVPTPDPVPIPAGDYFVRVSSAGRLSTTYPQSIERGSAATLAPNLEDQLFSATPDGPTLVSVERTYAIVRPPIPTGSSNATPRADVVLLDERGLRHPSWPSGGNEWSLALHRPDELPALLAAKPPAPGFHWPWHDRTSFPEYALQALVPFVTSCDLNQDGTPDIVVAARHQAWVLAVSGSDGGILWIAARGRDLTEPVAGPSRGRNSGATLATPVLVPDVDADDVPDWLVLFGDEQQGSDRPLRRWLECLSGRTGETRWSFDCEPAWFDLQRTGDAVPEAARWFVTINGRSGSGGSYGSSYDDAVRNLTRESVTGDAHFVPYPPELLSVGESSIAVLVAGTHLIGLDVTKGKAAWEPLRLGRPVTRPPQFARLSPGPGPPALLLLQPGASPGASRLSAWRLEPHAPGQENPSRLLWNHGFAGTWQQPARLGGAPLPWPLLEDLDGDGACEIVVPRMSPDAPGTPTSWGELELLDGATARPRWRRRLKSIDKLSDFFLAGPDVDGDGQRDLVVASLHGPHCDLYVDCLSAKTGATLWWNRREGTSNQNHLDRVAWWHAGPDGAPRLLVKTTPEYGTGLSPRLDVFSASTGAFLGHVPNVHQFELGDADGDGLDELFCFERHTPNIPMQGGRLHALVGTDNERWRQLGGDWQPGSDYDGDGHADLLWIRSDGVRATSGRTGRRLWTAGLPGFFFDAVQPADGFGGRGDFDADGVPDVLAFHRPFSGNSSGMTHRLPVVALSGRTGRRIPWSASMPFRASQGVPLLAVADLDAGRSSDGEDVIFSAFTDWNYASSTISTNRVQHWLVAVQGRGGRLRWRVPLSQPYGRNGTPPHSGQLAGVRLRPAFGDLNGDGVLDLVVPAEVPKPPGGLELRACSGRDGTTLWSRAYAPTIYSTWQNLAHPLVADLDGDGRPEVVGLEVDRESGARRRIGPVLFVLDGRTGQQRWKWFTNRHVAPVGFDPARQLVKIGPQLLTRRGRPPWLVVGVWDEKEPGLVAILDAQGRLLDRLELRTRDAFRPWIHDLDGDGDDDLIVLDDNELRAFRVVAAGDDPPKFAPLWDWRPPDASHVRVMHILPSVGDERATVVVQAGTRVVGLSGPTGQMAAKERKEHKEGSYAAGPIVAGASSPRELPSKTAATGSPSHGELRWTIAGPAPRLASGIRFVPEARLLAPAGSRAEPPAAVFCWGEHHTVYRVASRSTGALRNDSATKGTGRNVRLDPRVVRRPRWEFDSYFSTPRRDLTKAAWGVLLALIVLWWPGQVLGRMALRRQWSLRVLLTLPVLFGLLFVVLRVPVPTEIEPRGFDVSASRRFFVACEHLPVLVFLVVLAGHVRRWQWRSVLGWALMAVLMAGGWTAVMLRLEALRLAPEERLAITAWHIPAAVGFYLTALAATVQFVLGTAAANILGNSGSTQRPTS